VSPSLCHGRSGEVGRRASDPVSSGSAADPNLPTEPGGSATPLHAAATLCSQLEAVRCLVEGGADVNAGCPFPLLAAASKGNCEFVQYLIEARADVGTLGRPGNHADAAVTMSALHAAVAHANLDVAKCLLIGKADVNQSTNDGCTALWMAVQQVGSPDLLCCAVCQEAVDLEINGRGVTSSRCCFLSMGRSRRRTRAWTVSRWLCKREDFFCS
jgi:ankyrin repeat protein